MAPSSTPPLPMPATAPDRAARAGTPTPTVLATYAPAPRAAVRGAAARVAPARGRARDAASGGPHADATLDALLDSLRSERKLVDDLAATMRRQRAAVGADDLPAVDDTVFATHRILATLGQARLRRRQLNHLLAGADEIAMADLDAAVGAQMSDALRAARDELQASAAALARDVDVNRRVLRDALAHGDAHARVLADGRAADGRAAAGGRLVNRTA